MITDDYQLAEMIILYWRARGVDVAVEVIDPQTPTDAISIRSNLKNALPREWKYDR